MAEDSDSGSIHEELEETAGPASNSSVDWTEVEGRGSAPTMRNSHKAVVKDSFMIVHGGRGGSSTLRDLYILDLEELEWFKPLTRGIAPARECHDLEVKDKHVYCFGGLSDGCLNNDVHRLDTETWTWEEVKTTGNLPSPRDRHTLSLVGNKLYVFGGHDAANEYLNDFYELDLGTKHWTHLIADNPPIPRQHHSAAVVKDCVYIFGGKSASGCFNDLYVFDTKTNKWSNPSLGGIVPAGRWGHSAVANGSKMVVFGGWNGTWCFNDSHVLDCEKLSWGRLNIGGAVPQARAYHSMVFVSGNFVLYAGRNGLRRMRDTLKFSQSALDLATSEIAPDSVPSSVSRAISTSWKLKDFEFRNTLGTGSFGRVRLAKHIPSGKVCAVKILKKSEIIRLKQVEHIIAEKTILASIDHPFIVNLWGYFQDTRYLYLIQEFVVGGEFFTHLRRAGRFNNDSSCFYAAQIVSIFQYLHSKDIVYRDLKPENILLDHGGNIKLTDFGFAKKVEYRTWTLCGTPEYIAPEILLNKGHGKSVDWWALGILIYEMLAGNPPFVDDDPMGIYQKILAGRINFPRYFDRHAKDLIRKLLTADITKRLGNLKNGVEDIKRHKWFAKIDWTKLYNREMRVPFVPEIRGMDNPHNFEAYPETTPDPPELDPLVDPFLPHFS